jgi:Uma2 family endonuclease
MAAPILKYFSPSDYLEFERGSKEKHELFQGKIMDMAGASMPHNEIASNLIVKVGALLKGKKCRIYTSDLRVYIPTSESFTYPDATIICGKAELVDDKMDTVKNPTVIIEVMSPSTELNDRGAKFFNYMQIPSLKEYLLISSTQVFALSARKQTDSSWKFDELKNLEDALPIQSIAHEISLREIYENVEFEQ